MADTVSEAMQRRYSKENRWYYKTIDDHISPDSRDLLTSYSHVPSEEVDSHVYKIRDILWDYGPYPCVGEFKFLDLNLPSHPQYQRIIKTMECTSISDSSSGSSSPPLLLDLGCCVAQELRSLAHKGIDSDRLYGTDINYRFLETSYELFKDKDTFQGKLVAADIFSPSLFLDQFKGWENKFSYIHAGLFLHLFNWEQQIRVCCTIVKLLASSSGSCLIGEMVGCRGGGERNSGSASKFWEKGKERKQFLHDDISFQKLWDEVAKETEIEGKWKIEANLKVRGSGVGNPSTGCAFFTGDGIGWFTFSVERTD